MQGTVGPQKQPGGDATSDIDNIGFYPSEFTSQSKDTQRSGEGVFPSHIKNCMTSTVLQDLIHQGATQTDHMAL
jgi:hypothetical protein